jgi:uncharacterized membrane protein HdeD (DUF308 family)
MVYFCRFLGGVAVLFGIVRILGYFLREIEGVGIRYDFATGAFAIVAGAFLLWRAPEVANVTDVVIGLFILVDCVFKLQVAMDSKRMGASAWWITLLFTCVALVLGLLLIFDTFKGQKVLSIMMGIALVADGLQNLCTVIYASLFVKEVRHAVEDVIDEATAIETTGEVVADEEPEIPDFDAAVEAAAAEAEASEIPSLPETFSAPDDTAVPPV